MSANLSNVSALYKILYPQGYVPDSTYEDYPMLALCPRDENFFGSSAYIALKYGNGSKRSSSFTKAQSNSGATKNVGFTITRAKDYAIANIDHESMEASEKDEGAFVDLFKHEVDAAHKAALQSEAQSFAGDGSGAIGSVGAISGSTITLADIEQVANFEVGQVIVLGADATQASPRSGSLTISGVNRGTGVLTCSAAITTGISAAAVGDLIAIDGDWQAKPKGFSAWIPEIDPTSTAFFGVDRTPDLVRLGGVRGDLSALPIEEAAVQAMKMMNVQGASVDYGFVNYAKHAELENALGSKLQLVDVMSPIGIGFRGIKLMSGKRPVTILSDLTVKSDRMWLATMNSWKLMSLKKSIRVLKQDGLESMRVSNDDASEVRIGGYKQFACDRPGHNGNFKL